MAQFHARRKYQSKLPLLCGRPDLTPLIDVLFLSLIFFMLSSSFVQMSGMKVELPRVSSIGRADIEKFIVSIAYNENGSLIYFNDQPLGWEKLAEKLAETSSKSQSATIVIRADGRTPFEVVAKVMAMAERAQLSSFVAVMPDYKKIETSFEP